MKIESAYSFLVHPGRNEETLPQIGGTAIPPSSTVLGLLSNAFIRAANDCSIDIVFIAAADGSQNNVLRERLIALVKRPSIVAARDIALLLQSATTHRSGLGLFFVLVGEAVAGASKRVYLSRFPADNGITAEEYEGGLKVELLEQVFMKNAYAYKAAVFDGSNFDSDFWSGRAIDKQVSSKSTAISGYWIKGFLRSDFKTTAALGTRRFAQALRKTIEETPNIEIKHELTAVATLAKNFANKTVSIDTLSRTFNLTEPAATALKRTLQKPGYSASSFKFSVVEFKKHIKYRQLQLHNGALLTAPAGDFDKVFRRQDSPSGDQTTFTTEGRIVDESVRKTAK